MNKKDFIELSSALCSIKPLDCGDGCLDDDIANTASLHTWEAAVEVVANVCASQNDNFDRKKFYFACGFEE